MNNPKETIPNAVRSALLVATVAILLRIVLLIWPGDQVSPKWVLNEELHRGNIARELLDGPLLDLQDYHHAPNAGGSLVIGVLAAPCILLFGDNLFAVRLPSTLLHALGVFLLFLILDRGASRRAAWFGSALYAVGPPGYMLLSITAWGTHHEANTLVLLTLYLFMDVVSRPAGSWETSLRAVLLGVTAGFACYFAYSSCVALVALALIAFMRDPTFFLRRWFITAAVGFAIGILPWVRYNTSHQFAGLKVYDLSPLSLPEGFLLYDKFVWFWSEYLPQALFLRRFDHIDLAWSAVPIVIVFGSLSAFALWNARARIARGARPQRGSNQAVQPVVLELVVTVYVPLIVMAALLSNVIAIHLSTAIAHDGRYAAPLWPFACLLIGIGSAQLVRTPRIARRIGEAVVAGCFVVFLAGFAALLDKQAFPGSMNQPGTSTVELARFFAWKFKSDQARLARIIVGLERRTEDVRDGTIFVIASALKHRLRHLPASDPEVDRDYDALRFLHDRVALRYAIYCEESWAGEQVYGWNQRDDFRRDRAANRGHSRALEGTQR